MKVLTAISWDIKLKEIMNSGQNLPDLPDEERTSENRVDGCETPLWIDVSYSNNEVEIRGYTPAKIMRGLLFLLISPVQNKSTDEFAEFSFEQHLIELDLIRYLSPSRSNGIKRIVNFLVRAQTEIVLKR